MGCGSSKTSDYARKKVDCNILAKREENIKNYKDLKTKFQYYVLKHGENDSRSAELNDKAELEKSQMTLENAIQAQKIYDITMILIDTCVKKVPDLSQIISEALLSVNEDKEGADKAYTDSLKIISAEVFKTLYGDKLEFLEIRLRDKIFESEKYETVWSALRYEEQLQKSLVGIEFNSSLKANMISPLAEFIQFNKNLNTLNIIFDNNYFTEKAVTAVDYLPILYAIHCNTNIKNLSFGTIGIKNFIELGEEGQKLIADIARHDSIQTFALGNIKLDQIHFKTFAKNISQNPRLKAIALQGVFNNEYSELLLNAAKV